VDLLRFWIGSGAAQEQQDHDFDGWFDDLVEFAYQKERERKPLRLRVPKVPVTGDSGAFPLPSL
jgi:hypothetical protein